MAFIDYYKILGVDKTIPQKDVKRAYLKRAKQFHPDLHPDDPKAKAKFQALTEAYDVIGDPEKRAKYDKYGEQWKQAEAYEKAGAGFGGYGGAQGNPFEGFDFSSFGSGGAGGFSSFFQDLFGGGMRGGQGFGAHTTYKEEPKNTQATVTIDMYTALLGGDIMVTTGSGERLKLKVKPETQPGTKVRLRGKGRGGTDLILTYQVKLPTGLTERQKQLLQQMQQG
ncbi:MAG: DnaJ domain-containing protein [Prevotella sp.]|nr:DnaJ domain-containing protein [Prevotella sp.]